MRHKGRGDPVGDDRHSNLTDAPDIKIPPITRAPFAVISSRRTVIGLSSAILPAAPGYNPHSAGPARGPIQSGLQ